MIALGDLYKVVEAMAPLYFALGLGYGSVLWWRFFTAEQCGAINTLVVYFSMPFFTFDFIIRTDPFAMNYRVIAADAVAKLLAVLATAAWACCGKSKAGAYSWSITGFSLASLNNTLVVGVPLLDAMYGKWAQDLIVQIAVVQSIVWFPLLLLAFELRKAWVVSGGVPSFSSATDDDGGSTTSDEDRARRVGPVSSEKDEMDVEAAPPSTSGGRRISLWPMARTVGLKLARNPNVYASVLGVAWACVAYRWRIGMPRIVTGSLQVMSRTGTGMSMFSMGLFMGQHERIVACGAGLAALGMALRFVAGPLAALAGAAALGLRGDVLHFAIIQKNGSIFEGFLFTPVVTNAHIMHTVGWPNKAALPQAIASFVWAKEYGLHADVLSTAVIFGTLISLPVLITYYAVLDNL